MTKRKHLLLPSTSEMLTKKDNLTKVLQLPLVPLYPYSNSVVIPPFCTIHLKALDDSPFVQPFDPISQSMSCCSDSIKGTSPVWISWMPSTAATAENAQHDPSQYRQKKIRTQENANLLRS